MNLKKYKNQSFFELKNQHDNANLFEDKEFPAHDESIFYSENFKMQLTKSFPHGITWERPPAVFKNAEFIVDGKLIISNFF